MQCPHCGNTHQDKVRFCPVSGKPIEPQPEKDGKLTGLTQNLSDVEDNSSSGVPAGGKKLDADGLLTGTFSSDFADQAASLSPLAGAQTGTLDPIDSNIVIEPVSDRELPTVLEAPGSKDAQTVIEPASAREMPTVLEPAHPAQQDARTVVDRSPVLSGGIPSAYSPASNAVPPPESPGGFLSQGQGQDQALDDLFFNPLLCENCREPLAVGTTICPFCGTHVPPPVQPPVYNQPPLSPTGAQTLLETPSNIAKPSRLPYVIVPLLVLCCCLTVVGGWAASSMGLVNDFLPPEVQALISPGKATQTSKTAVSGTGKEASATPQKTATKSKPTETPKPTSTPEPTRTPTQRWQVGDTQTSLRDGMTIIYIPGGEFMMGAASGDSDAKADESPVRTVFLDPFWIDKTEVTNAMFERFANDTGYQTDAEKTGKSLAIDARRQWVDTKGANWRYPQGQRGGKFKANHPVVQVNWSDAVAYCEWAGGSLPTEAQWEKAARGADGKIYPWGNQRPGNQSANFADRTVKLAYSDSSVNDGFAYTAPVGNYPQGASEYGALDMAGNVWEWINDWYGENYYSQGDTNNPTGPASGEQRVLKGGAWNNKRIDLRTSNRGKYEVFLHNDYDGFRCVRQPESS